MWPRSCSSAAATRAASAPSASASCAHCSACSSWVTPRRCTAMRPLAREQLLDVGQRQCHGVVSMAARCSLGLGESGRDAGVRVRARSRPAALAQHARLATARRPPRGSDRRSSRRSELMRRRSLMRSRCSELRLDGLRRAVRRAGRRCVSAYVRSRSRNVLLLREQLLRALEVAVQEHRTCRGAGWRSAARAGPRSRACRHRRTTGACWIFLSRDVEQHALDDVADVLHVDRERHDVGPAPRLAARRAPRARSA